MGKRIGRNRNRRITEKTKEEEEERKITRRRREKKTVDRRTVKRGII